MKNFRPTLVAVTILVLLAGCGGGGSTTATPTPTPTVYIPITASGCSTASAIVGGGTGETSSLYAPVGDYTISTNDWGRGSILQYIDCISATSVGSVSGGVAQQTGITAKFNWSWPAGTFNVKAYPEILWQPNGALLNPIPFNQINTLTVNHDISISATGNFDVIYDMWADSISQPGRWPHDAEIIILMQSTWSNAPIVDTFTLNGNIYDVVVSTMVNGQNSWKFFVFASHQPQLKASIPIKPFTDYLVAKGYLPQSYYLSTVEFGAETIDGIGTLSVNSYAVIR